MPDVVGYRAKIGVIVPSTNTVVEHDLAQVRPAGVTFHSGRFLVEAPDLSTDEAFLHFLDLIRQTIPTAVRDIMTCEPDHILMGMSAETFWGGKEGNAAFAERVRDIAGDIGITSGASACNAALEKLGVSSIACLTPYQPAADEQVYGYFTECGFDVKRVHGLRCATATSIADVTPETLVEVLKALDGDDIDAIVQCGTNLSMVEVADQAERWLGKPVLAINAVCLWHALRTLGIDDQFTGHGTMLREF
ncbi:maleate cis-trans isomerase family protein [Candidatus Poriferisocius sp.]|uniref:maleate cis-trans isomerase family protein n=1 Tax=Candidatus Poriferisocius sp. TaxID=3101276 RepID=UPI003B593254